MSDDNEAIYRAALVDAERRGNHEFADALRARLNLPMPLLDAWKNAKQEKKRRKGGRR